MDTLQQRDARHLWHPYTQHQTANPPIAIVKAKDALLWDENGKQYIDAIASWWVNPFGHSNPHLARVAYQQLTQLEHVLFGGFTHEPAITLSENLIRILPNNQQKIFFSDNGSTAVEVAIKMAIQYHYNKGEKRHTIIAFEEAFHGDTFAAMAASGISFFTQAFKDHLLDVVRLPLPTKGKEEETYLALKKAIEEHQPAAFIFEPLVLGAAGMKMYPPKALDKLIEMCQKNEILTIADEVMTGFGKTGKNFACNFLKQQPDIICLSKALTGGTIPLAVTSATQKVYDAFLSSDVNKALFHGHTFMANPTACAIAIEAIRLLESDEIQQNIKLIEKKHTQFVEKNKDNPKIENIRSIGVILAFEIKSNSGNEYYGNLRNELYNFFIEKGIVLRPVGNTVYVLPPYIISEKQLDFIYKTLEEASDKFHQP